MKTGSAEVPASALCECVCVLSGVGGGGGVRGREGKKERSNSEALQGFFCL